MNRAVMHTFTFTLSEYMRIPNGDGLNENTIRYIIVNYHP